jgi:hypothetical protein
MNAMDLSGLPEFIGNAWTLAKEIGKGGGGSTEEPTVCFVLLPVGLGVLAIGLQRIRRRILPGAWRKDGRSGSRLRPRLERKVQTA